VTGPAEPSPDCPLCPRLADFREVQRVVHPDWYNAPVPGFGDPNARVLIVGLGGLGAVGGYAGLNSYTALGGSLTIWTLP